MKTKLLLEFECDSMASAQELQAAMFEFARIAYRQGTQMLITHGEVVEKLAGSFGAAVLVGTETRKGKG